MHLLLVEDDLSLASGLNYALTQEGMVVNHVTHGKQAIHAVETMPPDLIILDLGLPDMDGLEVIKQLRANQKNMPILVLTARDSVAEKVHGLDLGADDYLAKPFDMAELLARLRVLERHISSSANANKIKIKGVCLDTETMNVTVNKKDVILSKSEYMILKSLMQNAGRVLTRDSLESKLYRWGEEVRSNAIEVHVHHLRKKIKVKLIQTIHGIGYTIKK